MRAAIALLVLIESFAETGYADGPNQPQVDPCQEVSGLPIESNDCLEHTSSMGEQKLLFSCDNNVQQTDRSSFSVFKVAAHWDESVKPPKVTALTNGLMIGIVSYNQSQSFYGEVIGFETLDSSDAAIKNYKLVLKPRFASETTQDKGVIAMTPIKLPEEALDLTLSYINKSSDVKKLVPNTLRFKNKTYTCQSGVIEELDLQKLSTIGKS